MKSLVASLTLILSFAAVAAPTQRQINARAQQLLVSNIAELSYVADSDETGPLSEIWAEVDSDATLVTACLYNEDDEVFNCTTAISTSDTSFGTELEGELRIQYQLEKGANGLPSDFAFLTVAFSVVG